MFPASVLRTLRPLVVCHARAAVAPGPASCVGGVSRKQLLHAARRSLLSLHKVPSHCPSARLLSGSTHSEDGTLVYTGNLASAVRGLKMCSCSSSVVSLVLVPHILQGFTLLAAFYGFICFSTFFSPVLVHLITRGYVVRMYHRPDKDTYTAVTYRVFPFERRTTFHQSQVSIPAVSLFSTFCVNNTGMLVNPSLFATSHDYNHLMGYDKPFSFDADDVDRPEKS